MEDLLVRLSKADGLIVSKSTLYKWSANGKTHQDIFERLGGRVYVNITKLNNILSGKIETNE
jgi:hypothetical protein